MGQYNQTVENTVLAKAYVCIRIWKTKAKYSFTTLPTMRGMNLKITDLKMERCKRIATTIPSMPPNLQTKEVPINRKKGYTVLHLYP